MQGHKIPERDIQFDRSEIKGSYCTLTLTVITFSLTQANTVEFLLVHQERTVKWEISIYHIKYGDSSYLLNIEETFHRPNGEPVYALET